MNSSASNNALCQPPNCVAVTANSVAWLTVSNDSAKRVPTAITVAGLPARSKRANAPQRQPSRCAVAWRGVVSTALMLSSASSVSTPIETQAPNDSSQCGARQACASVDTPSATATTTPPWPSENNTPAMRASRGRAGAL